MRWSSLLTLGTLCALAAGCQPADGLPERPAKFGLRAEVEPGPDVYGWHAKSDTLYTYWGHQCFTVVCRGRFPGTWKASGDESWSVEAVNEHGTRVPFLGVVRRYRNMDGKEQVECLPAFSVRKLPEGLYLFIETAVKLAPDGSGPAEIRPNVFVMDLRGGGFTRYQSRIALFPDREAPLTPKPEVGEPPKSAVDEKEHSAKGAPLPGWF